MIEVQATIAGRRFTLRSDEVERRLVDLLPDPLEDHYVVVGGRRFPPKQVISVVTGLDRADFNTHQARQVLGRLGFPVGRRGTASVGADIPPRPGPHDGKEADALRPFLGKWVAQRGLEVLVAADTPDAVVAWLERHRQQADAMFRVPVDEADASGMAPR